MQNNLRYFKLTIEYDGTNFHGWQVQPQVRTVQGCIKEALEQLARSEVAFHGASRTDRGVHAFGQVARAVFASSIPAIKVCPALNGMLPKDVGVVSSEEVTENFHPRYQATGKHYRYLILSRKHRSPLLRHRTWHCNYDLDLAVMSEEAQILVGQHDFASFAPAEETRSTVREIKALSVAEVGSGVICVDVAGNGFLWKMVRTIVGTLVDLARGRFPSKTMADILAIQDRREAGQTAPPQGLALMKVFYDQTPRIVIPGSEACVALAPQENSYQIEEQGFLTIQNSIP